MRKARDLSSKLGSQHMYQDFTEKQNRMFIYAMYGTDRYRDREMRKSECVWEGGTRTSLF